MKKLVFALSFCMAGITHAQVDPLDQFFNQSFIPTLVKYDSIAVSIDSGINFNAFATATQHYFTNQKIDTLVITQGGMPIYTYDGILTGRTTELTGYDLMSAMQVDRIVFKQDSLYRDSTISYYNYTGSSFQLFFEAQSHYTTPTSSTIDYLDIFADFGGGLTKIGDYRYFYKNGILDSVAYTVSIGGNGDGYLKYIYDSTSPSKHLALETYEDIDNDGEKDLIQRLVLDHNMLGQVVQIREFNIDNSNNLVLDGEYRFGVQKNSTISIKELGQVKISLYPNPAHNYLQVDVDKDVYEEFTIYNMNGAIMSSGILNHRINVQHLPRGIYVLGLNGAHGSHQFTFEKL